MNTPHATSDTWLPGVLAVSKEDPRRVQAVEAGRVLAQQVRAYGLHGEAVQRTGREPRVVDRLVQALPGLSGRGSILHTVGPVHSTCEDRSELLASCYRESLRIAEELGARTLAFPAIPTGVYRWPIDGAARIAVATVRAALAAAPDAFDEIRLVDFDNRARTACEAALAEE
ncbi:macro domain-containing protein [Streptomyces noursei]|nr:macro domain-containing protein [Streptomyces noursei]